MSAVTFTFEKPHKYHVGKNRDLRTLDGHVFDSAAEMTRYAELKILQKAGEIRNLSIQPTFVIIPKKGKVRRQHVFTADFRYTEKNKDVVEDVKGAVTTDYKLRRDIFLWQYTDIVYREVHNGEIKEY